MVDGAASTLRENCPDEGAHSCDQGEDRYAGHNPKMSGGNALLAVNVRTLLRVLDTMQTHGEAVAPRAKLLLQLLHVRGELRHDLNMAVLPRLDSLGNGA